MNKNILIITGLLIAQQSFADIGATNGVANSATCDSGVLDTDSGGAALEAQYSPETINLKWYDNGTRVAANSCTYDNGISLPSNPIKTGYTFKGWRVIPGTRIEYLQSTGTQYIDTGFKFTGDVVKYDLTYNIPGNLNNETLFGASDNNTNWSGLRYFFAEGTNTNNNSGFYIGGRQWTASQFSYPGTTYIYSVTVDRVHNKYTEVRNGVKNSGTFTGTVTSTVNIALFGHRFSNSRVVQYASYKNYGFKITQDGTLVRDMIPIKDVHGVACMYDKVTGQFFYNQGTGNFIAGPEI